MRATRGSLWMLLIATLLSTAALPPAVAQTSGSDRLFLAFAEDAVVVRNQWWEGQIEYQGDALSDVDILLARGVVAFQPYRNLEIGGRVGFGDSDAPGGNDGSGATDLDAWAKYYFGAAKDTEFAVGALATIPTGDDGAGLGFDSFGLGVFGSVRHRLSRLVVTGHVGVRTNGDGMVFDFDLSGKTSVTVGGGVIVPLSDQVAVVGEARWEGKRFDEGDSDAQVLGGLNWRPFNRGMVRAAVAIGLDDGAPDGRVLVGYATQF